MMKFAMKDMALVELLLSLMPRQTIVIEQRRKYDRPLISLEVI